MNTIAMPKICNKLSSLLCACALPRACNSSHGKNRREVVAYMARRRAKNLLGDFGSGKLSVSAIPVFCRQIGMPFLRQNRTSASADIVEADSIYPVLNTFVTMPALGKRLRQTFRIFSSWASPRGLQTSKSISEFRRFRLSQSVRLLQSQNPPNRDSHRKNRPAPRMKRRIKSSQTLPHFFFVRTPSSRE